MRRAVLFLFWIGCLGLYCSCHGQEQQFRCPPCASDCHNTYYSGPGVCPVCNMSLIPVKENMYKGYQKALVRIKNGAIGLNAAYYSPTNNEKIKGALVIVHGSAPSTYEDVSYYTQLGTALGFAVLAFDKRGVGKSDGNYELFSVESSVRWFNLLSSDVVAMVEWLKAKPELKHAKIGLFGGSQAGWIMPLAASKTSFVDFMVIGEGVSVSAGEEHFFSQLTGDGITDGLAISEADEKLQAFDGPRGFDPRNILQTLNIETLWFFGTNDPVIPVNASIRELETINNPNFRIQLLPHGDHNFKNVQSGKRYDLLTYIKPWLTSIGVLD